MTVFSDLTTYLDAFLSAAETEKYLRDVYNETLAEEPALPATFADQTAYDAYLASVATWVSDCALALAAHAAAVVALDAETVTILAAVPVAEAGYTISRGGKAYSIGRFADANGNYSFRWQDVAGAISIMARPAVVTFSASVPTISSRSILVVSAEATFSAEVPAVSGG